MTPTFTFTCSICGECSTQICVYCTKDACANHICVKCGRCSDCCECEIHLDEHHETVADPIVAEEIPAAIAEEAAVPEPAPPEPAGPPHPLETDLS